jgi:hypothetical protein
LALRIKKVQMFSVLTLRTNSWLAAIREVRPRTRSLCNNEVQQHPRAGRR